MSGIEKVPGVEAAAAIITKLQTSQLHVGSSSSQYHIVSITVGVVDEEDATPVLTITDSVGNTFAITGTAPAP